MERYQMLIGGEWVDAEGGATFESENPFRGSPWALVPRGTPADVERAVEAAFAAYRDPGWRRMSASARGALLRRFGDVVAREADRLAELETTDNGKLITEMRAQLRYLPQWFHYFGGPRRQGRGPGDPDRQARACSTSPARSRSAWSPRSRPGTRRCCSRPGSSPRRSPPATPRSGSRPSSPRSRRSSSAGCSSRRASRPGVVNIVTGFGAEIGDALVTHPKVAKIAFTGGDRTGQAVYESAARSIKPVTLELGGKSANIVFDDAALDDAVKGVVSGIFAATGQTCIAGSRALIHQHGHRRVHRAPAGARAHRADGRPARRRDPGRPDHHPPAVQEGAGVHRDRQGRGRHLRARRRPGARARNAARAGSSSRRSSPASRHEMRIAQEEVFGPVLAIMPFDDDEEAIEIANGTLYGLAAGVWTQSIRRALTMARAARGRHRLGQHLPRGQLHVAVRRLQALRHRARERA